MLGHGIPDEGAQSSTGTTEAETNLKIALKVQNLLEQSGATVILTRSDENAIYDLDKNTLREKKISDIHNRVKIGNESQADIFVSIHQNMFPQSKCYGAQVWYASNENSNKLATSVQDAIKESVNDNNKRVAKPAAEAYLILRDKYEGASILVECGFLSNPEEEVKLKNEEHQNLIVDGISLGI